MDIDGTMNGELERNERRKQKQLFHIKKMSICKNRGSRCCLNSMFCQTTYFLGPGRVSDIGAGQPAVQRRTEASGRVTKRLRLRNPKIKRKKWS